MRLDNQALSPGVWSRRDGAPPSLLWRTGKAPVPAVLPIQRGFSVYNQPLQNALNLRLKETKHRQYSYRAYHSRVYLSRGVYVDDILKNRWVGVIE